MLDNLKSLVVRIATILKGKVDKVTGKSLVSDTLITKLQGLEKVTASEYLADNKLKLTLSDNSTVVTINSPDLSGYVQKETGKSLIDIALANTISQKVDKVPGKGLLKSEIASNLETNWNEFVNATKKYPTAIAITGTDTKKLVLTLNDSTTLESQWVDLKGSDVDFSGAGFDSSTGVFKINSSTQFSIDGRYRLISSKIPWADIEGAPTFPTIPSWVGATKPTYSWSEITDKPSLNFLPLTGGTIEPGNVSNYREGIRINKAANNWSVLTLGTEGTSGMQSGSWALLRNPSGDFQIGPDAEANSGLRLSTDFPYWRGGKIWNSSDNAVEGEANLERGRNLYKDTPLYVSDLNYNKLSDFGFHNSLTFGPRSGKSQLIMPWFVGGMYFRSLRDFQDNWTEPERIYTQRENLGSSNMLRGNCHVPFRNHNFILNDTEIKASQDSEGNLIGQFPAGLRYHDNGTEYIELDANTWYTISTQIKPNKDVALTIVEPVHFQFKKKDDLNVNAHIQKIEKRETVIQANKWTTLRTSILTGESGFIRLFIYNHLSDASFSVRYFCLEQGNTTGGYKPTQEELSSGSSGGVNYTRITDAHNWLNSPGKIFAADGNNVANAPSTNWYHFFGGTHTNTQNYNYQFALLLESKSNTPLYLKKRDHSGFSDWYQIPMFQNPGNDYADLLKTLYHWHYLTAFRVYKGVPGQGELRFQLDDNGAHAPIRLDSPYFRIHAPETDWITLHSKGYKLNVVNGDRDRSAAASDYRRVVASGYEIPNGSNKQILLSSGEVAGHGYGQHQEIDLRWLPEDKYFLVYSNISSCDKCLFRVHTSLDGKSRPSWSTHSQGFSLTIEFEQIGSGWGASPDVLNFVNYYFYGWSNVQPAMFISQEGTASMTFIYLRGGGVYTFYSYSTIGNDIIWNNPRSTTGDTRGKPNCMNWSDEYEIIPRRFISYKHSNYGSIIDAIYPIKTAELFLDRPGSNNFSIWPDGNVMNVSSRAVGGYTKVRASGYLVSGKETTKYLVLADGSVDPYHNQAGEIYGDWSYHNTWKNNLIYVNNPCTINLSDLENFTGLSFINLHTGKTTLYANGVNIIYLGAPAFQGARGTSCTVNRRHSEIFVHVNKL